jgi:RimJ/RimL family protein N-acetyltransferase
MTEVRIEPWSEGDFELLRRANAPEMTEHLGGPETEEKLVIRHRRYLAPGEPGSGWMFRVALPDSDAAGIVGYWERAWQGETVYESGWSVLPEFQGRSLAAAAVLLVIDHARAQQKHGFLHAFPAVDHPASNAVCRKAGFMLMSACDFEYPPGNVMRCNDWRVSLG